MSSSPEGPPHPLLLCGCLVDLMPREVSAHFLNPDVGMLEWRLDLSCRKATVDAVEAALPQLSGSHRHTVLVTNRPVREGGSFDGPEVKRLEVLEKAVDAGAEWVDLEQDVSKETVRDFRSRGARVLLSHHDFLTTLDARRLQNLVRLLASKGPHAIKMVTLAKHPEDNLRVLELISFARDEFNIDVVAFCMGPLGRWSRPASLLLGSPWTYVRMEGQGAAAAGQFTAREMRGVLAALRGAREP